MKSISLQPWQSKAAKEGRLRRLIVPMNHSIIGEILHFIYSYRAKKLYPVIKDGDGEIVDTAQAIKCPFSVGNTVGLKEKKVERTMGTDGRVEQFSYWAIRFHFTPAEIQAKKLGELTEEEAMECGIKDRQVAMRADSGSIEGAYDPMDYEDDISATRMAAFEFEWTHQCRRRPALAWNEKLWVWSVAGKVEVI